MKKNNKNNKYIISGLVSLVVIVSVISFYSNNASLSSSLSFVKNVKEEEFTRLILDKSETVILDVRTKEEYDSGHVEKAINIDYNSADFSKKISALDKNKTYLVYCRSGNRSSKAVSEMKGLGFTSIYNLSGGVLQSPSLKLIKTTIVDNSIEISKNPIKESLDMAIADEYKARAFYAGVLLKYKDARPFSMIVLSEEQHINLLIDLYKKYNIEAPKDNNTIEVYNGTLKEACSIGVEAEIENVKLYKEKLIPSVTSNVDVVETFNLLMNASESKHLVAFKRCA